MESRVPGAHHRLLDSDQQSFDETDSGSAGSASRGWKSPAEQPQNPPERVEDDLLRGLSVGGTFGEQVDDSFFGGGGESEKGDEEATAGRMALSLRLGGGEAEARRRLLSADAVESPPPLGSARRRGLFPQYGHYHRLQVLRESKHQSAEEHSDRSGRPRQHLPRQIQPNVQHLLQDYAGAFGSVGAVESVVKRLISSKSRVWPVEVEV